MIWQKKKKRGEMNLMMTMFLLRDKWGLASRTEKGQNRGEMAPLVKALAPKPAPSWHSHGGVRSHSQKLHRHVCVCKGTYHIVNFFNLQLSSLYYQESTAGLDKSSFREAAEEAGTDERKANGYKQTHRNFLLLSIWPWFLSPDYSRYY